MKIEITTTLTMNNPGVTELIKLADKKGKLSFDFKKGKIIIDDISYSKIDNILKIIRESFEISNMEINNEKKFKIRNDEKELQHKKQSIMKVIEKKPSIIRAQVSGYVFKEKVFTLTQLRETFPKTNFATLRAYVNDLKQENLIVELERGKYSIR